MLNLYSSIRHATRTARYVGLIADTQSQLRIREKPFPIGELAQNTPLSVAVSNRPLRRISLKENHIMAAGGIGAAVKAAKASAPSTPVEIEVESLAELQQAMEAGADIADRQFFGY